MPPLGLSLYQLARRRDVAQPIPRPPRPAGRLIWLHAPDPDRTPALAELIDISSAPDLQVHEGFDFWLEGQELQGDARESLERANASGPCGID